MDGYRFALLRNLISFHLFAFLVLSFLSYIINEKPILGSPPASGGFGQPAAGGFGSAPAPGFGAPAPAPFGGGGFGTPAPAPGGFGTTSAFGKYNSCYKSLL